MKNATRAASLICLGLQILIVVFLIFSVIALRDDIQNREPSEMNIGGAAIGILSIIAAIEYSIGAIYCLIIFFVAGSNIGRVGAIVVGVVGIFLSALIPSIFLIVQGAKERG